MKKNTRAVYKSTPGFGVVEVSSPTNSLGIASATGYTNYYRRQLYRQLAAVIRSPLVMKTMNGLMLSAIENGVRGASAELLAPFERAYNLAGAMDTDYTPHATPVPSEVA